MVQRHVHRFVGRGKFTKKCNLHLIKQPESFGKFYRQLLSGLSPIREWHRPFLADVSISKVNQLFQCRIVWENTFVFSHFAYLTVVSLYRVGSVDDAGWHPKTQSKPKVYANYLARIL